MNWIATKDRRSIRMNKVCGKRKLIYRKVLILMLVLCIVAIFAIGYIQLDKSIPDNIKIMLDQDEEFDFSVPMEGKIQSSTGVLSINNKSVPGNEIKFNLQNPFTIKASQLGSHTISLKLFGFLSFKQINLDVVETMELIPGGDPIGIYIETDGVMVLGTGVINGEDGLNYEPALNKLMSGDYIVGINDQEIQGKEQLMDIIAKSEGKDLKIELRRKNELLHYNITPVKSTTGEYKIGAWIRDDTQGIGTLTFVSQEGDFGALGHAITDVDTSMIMEAKKGHIYSANITTIIRGKQGEPGELIGSIKQDKSNIIGDVKQNTPQGIFGKINNNYKKHHGNLKSLPIGLKQEIVKGPAKILSCVDSEIKEYDILIEDVTLGRSNSNKGIVIKIIDEELLKKTGGIVQGMSGSPIIQNNKIIGAVTHVFIQDSTKGYGTFIENMIYNIDE